MRVSAVVFTAAFLFSALPAVADDFAPISDKSTFLSLIENKDLRIGLYDLTLKVSPDGRIDGEALGWDISGTWSWQDGYFCREMDWSGKAIGYDCQLVELRGADTLRFTVNKGAGNTASFKLR